MNHWQEAAYVLYQVWAKPITTKSDKAREWADTIAWATARGYLSTEVAPWTREYSNIIKVTSKGLLFVEEILSGIDRECILGIINGDLYKQDGELEGTFRLD